MATVEIALLDDHELILGAFESLKNFDDYSFHLVAAERDQEAFEEMALDCRPDVAVGDLVLNGKIRGHETIERLNAAGLKCLAMTADHRRVPIRRAVQAGARGVALKSDGIDKLSRAIAEVAKHGWATESPLVASVLASSEQLPPLSPRELMCLRLAAEGVPLKAIGAQLDPPISMSTVKTYIGRAFEKFALAGRAVSSTPEAITQLAGDGWFDLA